MIRKSSIAAAALALGLALGGPVTLAHAADHSHHHHGAIEQLQLNQGQKWLIDAPLRKGMDDIRADVAANIGEIHHNRMSPTQYTALADKLTSHIEYIVVNCQLPRDADDQLHLVLAAMLGGIEQMKTDADQRAGAIQVIGALDAYGQHFDHPGWKALQG